MSMKFQQLMKAKNTFIAFKLPDAVFTVYLANKYKMQTLVGILISMRMIHFMLSWVEHDNNSKTSTPYLNTIIF